MKPKLALLFALAMVLSGQSAPTISASCGTVGTTQPPCIVGQTVTIFGSGYAPNLSGGFKTALAFQVYCPTSYKNRYQNTYEFIAFTDSNGNITSPLWNWNSGNKVYPLVFGKQSSGQTCLMNVQAPDIGPVLATGWVTVQ
jgi:hypothetical protein